MAQAFLVLCHQSDALVKDLFRYVYAPENLYILNIDRKAPAELHQAGAALQAVFANVHVLPSRYCSWGGFSLVEAVRAGMERALGLRDDWSHFILLSEQCVPLLPAGEIGGRLTPGVSEIGMVPVRDMAAEAKADVADRFAFDYRELPGVGGFAAGPRSLPVPGDLHHGSQWVILARDLCRWLTDPSLAGDWEVFSTSLLADETAIQTLAARAGQKGARMNRQGRTWVPRPDYSGDKSLVFYDSGFMEAARNPAYLFARKRPEILPGPILDRLESQAAFSKARLQDTLDPCLAPAPRWGVLMTEDELVWQLRWRFAVTDARARFLTEAAGVNRPRCYVRFGYEDTPPNIHLCLLSEDMVNYKIVLAMDDDEPLERKGLWVKKPGTSIIRARIFGLHYGREIMLALDHHGFITLRDPRDLSALTAGLRHYLNILDRLREEASLAIAGNEALPHQVFVR
jgi:hypothetical protein